MENKKVISTRDQLLHVAKDITSSIVGSAACVYSGQPFDTIKVRMQVRSTEYTSAIECFKKTLSSEGVLAFWKGSMPAFTGALLENAAAFGTNGLLKRLLLQYEVDSNSFITPILCGGFTGFCSAFVLCPCDVVKCRTQMRNMASSAAASRHGSVAAVVTDILRRRGPAGLYAGIGAQLMRDIPFYGSFFGSYDLLCRGIKANTTWTDTFTYLVAGGLAGQVGWLASIAPDSVKSRIQASEQRIGIAETAQSIYRARGFRGFFVGLEVAIVRAFPANAALFVGYELTKELFESTLLDSIGSSSKI